jgi:hypothetical protein
MMLKREDIHWFYDIGYQHDGFEHCPLEPSWLINDKCDCNPATSFRKSLVVISFFQLLILHLPLS